MDRKLLSIVARVLAEDETVVTAIDQLTDAERISVRDAVPDEYPSPRNLWFNYRTQEWIGCEPVAGGG